MPPAIGAPVVVVSDPLTVVFRPYLTFSSRVKTIRYRGLRALAHFFLRARVLGRLHFRGTFFLTLIFRTPPTATFVSIVPLSGPRFSGDRPVPPVPRPLG